MKAATVAVVVPAFNASPYLAQALDSILAQTFQDWQAFVVDDGSTDDTGEIAASFARRDPRVRCLRTNRRGVSAARNAGIQAGQAARYFAFLDSDDLWRPEKLERQLHEAAQGPYALVYCGYRRFGPGAVQDPDWARYEGPHSGPQLLQKLVASSFLSPCCSLIEGRVIRAVGGFDEGLTHAEDWDFAMRIAAAGFTAYGSARVMVDYRCRQGSLSSEVGRCFLDTVAVLERHLPPELANDPAVLAHLRLRFRNDFTSEGARGRFEWLDPMLLAYLRHDGENPAARGMAWLRPRFRLPVFWALSRYLVIPLAWHLERWRVWR